MIISQDQFFLATNVNLVPRAFPFHEFPQSSLLFISFKSNVLGDRQKIFEKKSYQFLTTPVCICVKDATLLAISKTSFVNFFKSAHNFSRVFWGQWFSFFKKDGNINNRQSIFVCFSTPTTPLSNCVWRGCIEFGARNAPSFQRAYKINHFFAASSETFAANFLIASRPF